MAAAMRITGAGEFGTEYIMIKRSWDMNVLDRLSVSGIIPVTAIEDAEKAVPAARALLAGGVDVMEITFRTDAAEESIRRVKRECPEICLGAGTVINMEQCRRAISLGCEFIVMPGFDREIAEYCISTGTAVTPGCVTPTEIMEALKLDLHVLKFFPAGIFGGIKALKALAGPFGDKVRFIPTGGVNAENLAEYAASKYVHAIGGTWVCASQDIKAGSFDRITALCKEAREIISEHRP